MDVKRMLTLIFGLVLVSYLAMKLVWYMNPPSRPHYNNFFAYDYSTVNYVQFIILFLIPSIAALFLYRSSFKTIDSFYDQSLERVKKTFFILEKNKETVLVVGIVVFWIFNLMEHGFFRNLVEDKNPFHSPFDTYHEGEKVAFLYTFLGNNEALKHMFIIHGYFLEVLTSYFAYLIAPENHSLMGFRILFTLQCKCVHFTFHHHLQRSTEYSDLYSFGIRVIVSSPLVTHINHCFIWTHRLPSHQVTLILEPFMVIDNRIHMPGV